MSVWLITVGLSTGLIIAFRELFDRPNRLLKVMAAASFGAYIPHPAIVVALQAAIADVTLAAFAKFAVVSLLGTAAALTLAHLAGQVPGIRAVVGATSGREASLVSGAGVASRIHGSFPLVSRGRASSKGNLRVQRKPSVR